MLSYAKPISDDIYSFDLTEAQTASVLMGNGETWQEDSAIFFQTMCVLHGNEYEQPTEDTVISDLCDVMLYLDFKGIFDRDSDNPKTALIQKKTESMFRPEGITLDFGHGKMRYLAFERSGSMSRNARLSFVRADVYDALRRRNMGASVKSVERVRVIVLSAFPMLPATLIVSVISIAVTPLSIRAVSSSKVAAVCGMSPSAAANDVRPNIRATERSIAVRRFFIISTSFIELGECHHNSSTLLNTSQSVREVR